MDYLGHYQNRTVVPCQLLSPPSGRSIQSTKTQPDQAQRTPSARHRRLTPEQIAELIARYEAGSTVYELGDAFKINRKTVSIILKREGITTRHRKLTDQDIEQAIALYNEGHSLESVATQLNVTAGAIHHAFKQRGIPRRPVGTNQWTATA